MTGTRGVNMSSCLKAFVRLQSVAVIATAVGCAGFSKSENDTMAGTAKASSLTPGMVKLKIEKGKTTQADVLETFGPPDQTTHRGDTQVWTYDKISYQVRADSGTLIFYSAQSASSQSVSTMLIVYFGKDDVVREYRLDTYKF